MHDLFSNAGVIVAAAAGKSATNRRWNVAVAKKRLLPRPHSTASFFVSVSAFHEQRR